MAIGDEQEGNVSFYAGDAYANEQDQGAMAVLVPHYSLGSTYSQHSMYHVPGYHGMRYPKSNMQILNRPLSSF